MTSSSEAADKYFVQGKHFLDAGQIDPAIEAFRRALEHEPRSLPVHMALVQMLMHVGRQSEAINFLLKALEIDPFILPVSEQVKLVEALLQQGHWAEAYNCAASAVRVEPGCFGAHDQHARCALRLGRLDQAIRAYKRMLLLNPGLAESGNQQHFRATIPYKIWQIESALDDLAADLAECPEVLSNPERAVDILFYQGTDFARSGRLEESIESFTAAVEQEPSFAEAHYCLALTLSVVGKMGERTDLLAQGFVAMLHAAELRDNWAAAYFQLGFLGRRLPDGDRPKQFSAEAWLLKTLEIDPEYYEAELELGFLHSLNGYLTRGIKHYTAYYRGLEKRAAQHPLGRLGIRLMDEHAVTAIGHMAQSPDNLLKSQALGTTPSFKTVILAPKPMTANPAMLDLWNQHLAVASDATQIKQLRPLLRDLLQPSFLGVMPDGSVTYNNFTLAHHQSEWNDLKRGPLLNLPTEARERGWDVLLKLGVPRDAWFVAFHVRQPGYKPERKGDLYDRIRNADPNAYLEAIKLITARGGWVIRLGERTMDPIPEMDRLVDYARSEQKSDWMDIFLASQCNFFLGGTGGLAQLPQAFHRPLAASDFPPGCEMLYSPGDLWTPQLLFSRPLDRFLTFSEMLSPPYAYMENVSIFALHQVEFVKNTSDEVLELTREMLECLNGTISYTPDEEERQERYARAGGSNLGKKLPRVGRYFLKKHEALLPK
jgi:putative glycosyltransferase (TIGR04372 family)